MANHCNCILSAFYMKLALAALSRDQKELADHYFHMANEVLL